MKRLLCWFGVHKYYVLQHFSKDVRRVACKGCKKTWGMNDRVQAFIKWDSDLAELQTMQGHTIKKDKTMKKPNETNEHIVRSACTAILWDIRNGIERDCSDDIITILSALSQLTDTKALAVMLRAMKVVHIDEHQNMTVLQIGLEQSYARGHNACIDEILKALEDLLNGKLAQEEPKDE